MTLHHIIGLAATAVFFYALWMCLLGATYIFIDQFSDWYHQFKQARKDKAAQKSVSDKQSGGIAK